MTAKSRADILTEIAALLNDNIIGDITAADLRTVLIDTVDSLLAIGTMTIVGGTPGNVFYNSGNLLGELTPTGSGNAVLSTSPTLVTPILGTPASGNLSNCTAFPAASLSGAIPTPVNAQTGTSYTIQASDIGKLVTFSNADPIAVTLPQATGSFVAGSTVLCQNIGAGTATITPTTSTVDGVATLVLATGKGSFLISDGANWATMRGGA